MKLRTLVLADLPDVADCLCEQITMSGFEADHILYIETAGRLLGYLLHERLGWSIGGVLAERPGSRLKKKMANIISLIPLRIREILRQAEMVGYQKVAERRVSFIDPLPLNAKTFLLVDDSIDTGATINSVIQHVQVLKNKLVSSVKVAAINTTVLSNNCIPDYVCYKNQYISFPWSSDSPERNRFLKIYNTLPASLHDLRNEG